jgi:hypothetical protein
LLTLLKHFWKEPLLLQVIEAMYKLELSTKARDRWHAKHQAKGYIVEQVKLYRVGGGMGARARARRECITKEEAQSIALKEHMNNGHWH